MQLTELGIALDFELIEQLRELPGKYVSVTSSLSIARKADGKLDCKKPAASGFNVNESFVNLAVRTGDVEFDGVRLRWLGRRDRVPAPIRQVFETVEQQTADLRKLTLALAVDYGGRWELAQAALQFAAQHGPAALDQPDLERRFAACLPGGWLPDVDLLIRTSGEKRISNFLPWQASYAELYFTPVLWPDFGAADLQTALAWYHRRVRRYGAVAQTVTGVAGGNTSR